MPEKKEIIRLDARLVDMLPPSAFMAELANGHRFVAYVRREDRDTAGRLEVGAAVAVEFSPYDMSKGRILPRTSEASVK